jgi:hypothetical protein
MRNIIAYYSLTIMAGKYIKVKEDEIVYGYAETLRRKISKITILDRCCRGNIKKTQCAAVTKQIKSLFINYPNH